MEDDVLAGDHSNHGVKCRVDSAALRLVTNAASTATIHYAPAGALDPEVFMKSRQSGSSQKLARIQLVARACIAWEQVRDGLAGDKRSAARARMRLTVLNRALAVLALQG